MEEAAAMKKQCAHDSCIGESSVQEAAAELRRSSVQEVAAKLRKQCAGAAALSGAACRE